MQKKEKLIILVKILIQLQIVMLQAQTTHAHHPSVRKLHRIKPLHTKQTAIPNIFHPHRLTPIMRKKNKRIVIKKENL